VTWRIRNLVDGFTLFDKNLHEIIGQASAAFFLMVAGAILSYLLNLIITRMLGVNDAGLYFLSLSLVLIGTTLGVLGLENSIVRFIASSAANNNWGMVHSIYKKSIFVSFISTILITTIVFFLAENLALTIFDKPRLASPLKIMVFSIAPLTFLTINTRSLQGIKRINSSIILRNLLVPALSIVSAFILIPFWGLSGANFSYVFACSLSMIISFFYWKAKNNSQPSTNDRFSYHQLLSSCLPLFIASILSLTISWTSEIMVGIYSSASDVAIFSVANRTAQLTTFILLAVNSIAAPKFSEMYVKGDLKALQKTVQNTTLLLIVLSLPILLLLLAMPSFFMGLFGDAFKSGSTVLTILVAGQFINVSTGSVGILLIMTGNESWLRNNTMFIAALTIWLNYLFIPTYGILGASIASAISLSLMNITTLFLVRWRLNIWTIPNPWKKRQI
jgi:O-antigen/teichoic acid export membrane protein